MREADEIEWDEAKSRENLRKHGVRFETAVLAFEDTRALTQRDVLHSEVEEWWMTLGSAGLSVVFVVHTWRDEDVIRLISARAATTRERKAYEEAYRRAEAGDRGGRGKARRRD